MIIPEGDDDELGVPSPLLDVVGDYGDILEVQGGVDLVHHVERGGLVVVEGEDQGERGEGLLPTGEVGNVLPGFLWWPHAEHDTLSEGVETVHQLELGVSAQGDHLVHLLQLAGDDGEPGVTIQLILSLKTKNEPSYPSMKLFSLFFRRSS